MLILYVLIAVGGYYLFGNAVERNVLDNLQPSILKTIISVLMAIHVSAAILIVINPVNIAFEETVGVTGNQITLKPNGDYFTIILSFRQE